MRRWLRSLQVQLFLWAIMPVTFVIIALSFTGVYAHQQGMRDFVVDRDSAMVRLLAQIAEDGIAHGIVGSNGNELARWMGLDTRDLRGTAMVLDGSGRVLAHSRPEQVGTDLERAPGIAEAPGHACAEL